MGLIIQQSSYSTMLNIPEPVPTIPEFVNSNSQPCLGIPSYSGVAQKRNSGIAGTDSVSM
jgi:hypothetical protein